ncbi:MAG: DUF433 domain-containing protein [Pyrinomonadaceae bacterium]
MNYKEIITIEPNKGGGKPCIRGMRMTVYDVLEYLASGMTEDEILNEFPYLTKDDIIACLVYGADGEEVSPVIARLQNELAMKKTPNERIEIANKMFVANREMILNSLPKDLPEEEIKKQLYFRTYGEELPDDFFER